MKTKLTLLLVVLLPLAAHAADDLSAALQKGLFEEEANQNLPAAIKAYESLLASSDEQRKLAATALFRLGECYRKLGRTNDAVTQYQRLLRDYADQSTLATLSRQNLTGLGATQPMRTSSSGSFPDNAVDSSIRTEGQRETSPDAEELMRTERLLAQLKGWDLSRLRRLIPTLVPDAEMERLEAEVASSHQKLQRVENEAGTPEEKAKRRDLLTLQMREGEALLESRAESIVKGLEQRAASLRGRVKRLSTIVADPNRTTAGLGPTNPLNEEEQEIRRIQALVKDSPDLINANDQLGQRPLHMAASRGQLRVAEYLIANGADLNAASLYNGAPTGPTPLRAAAAAGHKKMVELLLSKGANIQGNGNSTALHDAAGKGYKSIVEALLASNADVNAQDRLGATPLVYAVKNNHLAVARLLLANKAKTEFTASSYHAGPTGNLRDFAGQYPLHIAVRARHEEMVELLLQNGADPNVKVNGATGDDSPGATPLLLAVDYKLKSAMLALLKAKADPAIAAGDARTPLHAAIYSHDLLELLLENHINPNVTNQFRATALHWAAAYGKLEAAVALIKNGADINATDHVGYTPLHNAAQRGYQDMVQLLLTNKANVNAQNKGGDTPLELSKTGNSSARYDIAKLLQQYGAVADLPKFDRIVVRHPTTGFEQTVFQRGGTNDWNSFTLLEAIAVTYGIATSHTGPKLPNRVRGGRAGFSENQSGFRGAIPFPNLEHIVIKRPVPGQLNWSEIAVDLISTLRTDGSNCSGAVPLQWGDVVLIPELDHPVNEQWSGFTAPVLATLKECLSRTIKVTIKGETASLTLVPDIKISPNGDVDLVSNRRFMLMPVLRDSNMLRTSSDLARVTITRGRSAEGKPVHRWVLDCSGANPLPDLWLRDGDEIEVPEKDANTAPAPAPTGEIQPGALPSRSIAPRNIRSLPVLPPPEPK